MGAELVTPRFEDALDVTPLDNGRDWRVVQAFHYDTDVALTPAHIPEVMGGIGIPATLTRTGWLCRHGHRFTVANSTHTSGRCPVCATEQFGATWRIEVPQGFVTDFASIPRWAWGIVGGPADGKYRKIAVVHDLLYRTVGLATRPQADAVLLEGMKVSGCSWRERTVIYSAVRIGGATSYKGGL